VDGGAARAVLLEELPGVLGRALTPEGVDPDRARLHVETVEDAAHLRGLLPSLGLVAFVADGSVLPRESGAIDLPLREGAVPFESPAAFRVEAELPNRGRVTGMGIPGGVTLVAGGGFHGKSTLLSALSWGVYDHVPGDGRELVVTLGDAVKVRAEDGRSVAGVDISAMIGELPGGRSTEGFSTPNASGSTSQAANIAEALEIGTSLLLVDEDTSATNFMIRDERMRELVRREPIYPFMDLVRPLLSLSGRLDGVVVGGVGDYLDVADRVILLEDYAPSDATDPRPRRTLKFPPRAPLEDREVRPPKTAASGVLVRPRRGRAGEGPGRGLQAIELGRERVDLSSLEQLAEAGQTEAIARLVGRFVAGARFAGCGSWSRRRWPPRRRAARTLGGFGGHPGR
jgi:predicted ABC-class ATPase